MPVPCRNGASTAVGTLPSATWPEAVAFDESVPAVVSSPLKRTRPVAPLGALPLASSVASKRASSSRARLSALASTSSERTTICCAPAETGSEEALSARSTPAVATVTVPSLPTSPRSVASRSNDPRSAPIVVEPFAFTVASPSRSAIEAEAPSMRTRLPPPSGVIVSASGSTVSVEPLAMAGSENGSSGAVGFDAAADDPAPPADAGCSRSGRVIDPSSRDAVSTAAATRTSSGSDDRASASSPLCTLIVASTASCSPFTATRNTCGPDHDTLDSWTTTVPRTRGATASRTMPGRSVALTIAGSAATSTAHSSSAMPAPMANLRTRRDDDAPLLMAGSYERHHARFGRRRRVRGRCGPLSPPRPVRAALRARATASGRSRCAPAPAPRGARKCG